MILLETNYSKKIGLPGYSSHQFSVSLKTELADVTQLPAECSSLYARLQQSVDSSIQKIGYLPIAFAVENGHLPTNGNGNGKATANIHGPAFETDHWNCTDKQQELILKITGEHQLDKSKVEQLAQDRFGKSVRVLNKLEASGLIDELLAQTGQSKPRNARFSPKAGGR